MKRRELIASAGTALLAWPRVARAATEIARLGFLGFGNPEAATLPLATHFPFVQPRPRLG